MNWRIWASAAALLVGLAACGEGEGETRDATPTCAEGNTLCGLSCVDTTTDIRHCGGCGAVCGAGEVCADGACLVACPAGQVECDGGCHVLDSSDENCGACGNACASGEMCADGACQPACPAGQEFCDGTCQSLETSTSDCGACGNACAAGEVCVEGGCLAECPGGQVVCDGVCQNLEVSGAHCGSCGNACGAGEVCADGQCSTSCAGDLVACDGTCRDLEVDRAHCGSCGVACGDDELCVAGACAVVCAEGLTECDEACRDTSSDRANCGACGNTCAAGEICSDGACVLTCGPLASTVCDGACTNTDADPMNCGACGTACGVDQVCSNGVCADACEETAAVCFGGCTSVVHDPLNCGTCGNNCVPAANAFPVCSDGDCASVCTSAYGDCDGDLGAFNSNGCEVSLLDDTDNCGACGVSCGDLPNASATCTLGACELGACDAGYSDCDLDPATGCETATLADAANCGACGFQCAAGEFCNQGTCEVPGPGENCDTAAVIVAGTNSIYWTASQNDYFGFDPTCMTVGDLDGPDLVLQYSPTETGEVELYFDKPTSTRWLAMINDGACGPVTPQMQCISDWSPNFMAGSFNVVAGATYYIHVIDTTSGTAPLDYPLNVTLTEFNCSVHTPATPTAFTPAMNATATSSLPTLEVEFDAAIDDQVGTVTITGSLGTSQTFTLPTAAISVSSDGMTMTINPTAPFTSAEVITVEFTGFVDDRCGSPVVVPVWTFNAPFVPCTPGTGGMVGTTMTRVTPPNLVGTVTEYYVAADADPNGYVYVGGTTTLYRMPKAGGNAEAVHVDAGLGTAHLGYTMLVDGQNIYTVDSKTSGTTGHVYRISADGGTTWNIEDAVTFPSTPADDFRGITAHGNTIFLITSEFTSTAQNQVWSFDATATLPAQAVLEAEFPAGSYTYCSGLAADAAHLYTTCRVGSSGTNYAVLQIDRATGSVTEIASGLAGNTTKMTIHAVDTDADGLADFLYRNDYRPESEYICDPRGLPYIDRLYSFGSDTANYGLGFDRAANVLWSFDDETNDFVKIQ